ncbi:MAG: DUF1622 domain-containing protein [Chthoniobacterales bacterium]|nr:DUF1622 domain-containing protein [Chthoniobacterales bacterium]
MNALVLAVSEPAAPAIEETIVWAVQWLKLGIETIGAALITLGVLVAVVQLIRQVAGRDTTDFTATRLTLARYLALALEFQLGADILSTAIAPSWQQIGKLGAIAVIRTGLNYFLSLEMKSERRTRDSEKHAPGDASSLQLETHFGLFNWLHLPSLITIARRDAYDYACHWWHKFMHLASFFWRFHNVHHTDLDIDVSTASRPFG